MSKLLIQAKLLRVASVFFIISNMWEAGMNYYYFQRIKQYMSAGMYNLIWEGPVWVQDFEVPILVESGLLVQG